MYFNKGAKKLQEKIVKVQFVTPKQETVTLKGQGEKIKQFDAVTTLMKLSNEEWYFAYINKNTNPCFIRNLKNKLEYYLF